MMNPNEITEIYDDILKFYFRQNYLDAAAPAVRKQFVGTTLFEKTVNCLTPFAKFLKRHFSYQKKYQPYLTAQNLTNKVWLFVGSKNNRESLKFLTEDLSDAVLVGNGIAVEPSDHLQLPFHQAVKYIYRFPKIWRFFNKKYPQQTKRYLDFLFQTIGLYEVALETMKKYPPKALVLANDHSEKQRALLNAAKHLNIPTIYLQHASISEFMPPLDFDLSLLEGQDAWDKYAKKGKISGKVQLIGMPKFDGFIKHRNYSKTVKNIGVCTNLFDHETDINQLLNALATHHPDCFISFRPHPGDKRSFLLSENVQVSGKNESIFEFLKQQDLLIAGSSSVHLEAVLLNITSIYYEISPLQKNMQDAYGYVKNGLIPQATSEKDLLKLIEKEKANRTFLIEKAQYYNALVGTVQEGQSAKLAATYIQDFLKNQK